MAEVEVVGREEVVVAAPEQAAAQVALVQAVAQVALVPARERAQAAAPVALEPVRAAAREPVERAQAEVLALVPALAVARE
ncbi:MAG TPA: hypothetical protein VMH26_05085, partial [Burkholderiales bacterium]|nr:hypothetical protein [Burkholderiales bacterium]